MKSLVIYDSNFGNTRTIAQVIAKELNEKTKVVSVNHFQPQDLNEVKLLIVGSPIIAWKPSERMCMFLATLKPNQLNGVFAVAYDTRVKLFIHGDAAKKIENALRNAGAKIVIDAQMFYVKGKEGPLFEGEIEKAIKWCDDIKKNLE